ncbi:RICIN domain-containing protein [Yersinia pekkanenii]|uniref:Ricin-type beta-trefoil lectin domain n=1 Tax=Yersinia pekkanenii TaxID=1288385 RepID=A0A0T9RNJ8_9GAMM|nr:RICIN domain-containing protein [Yersinia pekkanenii]CNI73538.1 Ricin-type beta-trefoil lectin domain [Yersinia pekkanenii]CRY69708.1 Ricin-type beta-trefoil lectin domain [Yersinia pekkanenii]
MRTVHNVFRADTRDFETVQRQEMEGHGGFRPHVPNPGFVQRNNLTYHFQGVGDIPDSNQDVSASVATTWNFERVVAITMQLIDPNDDPESEHQFDPDSSAYIYDIRPAENFFDLIGSFEMAIYQARSERDSDRVERLSALLEEFSDMDEIVAHNGFGPDRVIRYAELTGEMLNTIPMSELANPQYWEDNGLWTVNDNYNRAYDNDYSNPLPYEPRLIGTPTGYVIGITGEPLRLDEFTPLIYTPLSLRNSHFSHNRHSRSVNVGKVDQPTIPKHKRIAAYFYDTEYYIRSSIKRTAVVDMSQNESGANVYVYQDLGLINQLWRLQYHKDKKAYKIVSSKNPKLCLAWDSYRTETSVVVRQDTGGTDDEFWTIEPTKDGFFTIKSFYSEFEKTWVLDLTNSNTNDRADIKVYPPNNTMAQKWEITSRKLAVLPDGTYQIRSSIHSNAVIQLSKTSDWPNVNIHENLYQPNQVWIFSYIKEKRAYIISSGLKEDRFYLSWDSNHRPENIFGYKKGLYDDQCWIIEETKDGFYVLKSYKDEKKAIDLSYSNINNMTNIQFYPRNNSKAQKWQIEPVNNPIIPDGVYKISTKLNYRKVLDYRQPSFNLVIQDDIKLKTSEWRIVYDYKLKAYRILNENFSNMGIFFQKENSPVKIDNVDSVADDRSYWIIEYDQNKGGYIIRSLVYPSQIFKLNDSTANGTDVLTYYPISLEDNQIWNFIPVK